METARDIEDKLGVPEALDHLKASPLANPSLLRCGTNSRIQVGRTRLLSRPGWVMDEPVRWLEFHSAVERDGQERRMLLGPVPTSMRQGELAVLLEKTASAGKLEIVLGEKDLADRVLKLL